MKKYIPIAYFIILFLILSSYLLFATPTHALRLSVNMTGYLSPNHTNTALVIARDLDNGSVFPHHRLSACWITAQNTLSEKTSCLESPLPEQGQAFIDVPPVPQTPTAALAIHLIDDNGKIRKTATLRSDRFTVQAPTPPARLSLPSPGLDVFAPAAFLLNTPNDVFITTPNASPLSLAQIYGNPAQFPQTLTPNELFIARASITLSGPADFEFTQNDKKFYASFVPNEKPFHATVNGLFLSPSQFLTIQITPVGSPTDMTLDLFDGNAWIAHKTIPADQTNRPLDLSDFLPRLSHTFQLYHLRLSASAIASPSFSQTIAFWGTSQKLPSPPLSSLIDSPPDALKTAGDNDANTLVRLSLDRLSSNAFVPLSLSVHTETDDQKAFEQSKSIQKNYANIALIFWFCLGFVLFIANALSARSRAETDNTTPNLKNNHLPGIILALGLIVLMLILLFYMMQLI